MFGKLPIGQARIFSGDELLQKAQTNPDLYGFLLSSDIYGLFVDTNEETGMKILNDGNGGSGLIIDNKIENNEPTDSFFDDDEEEKQDFDTPTNKPLNVKPHVEVKYIKQPPQIVYKTKEPTMDAQILKNFNVKATTFDEQLKEILQKAKNMLNDGMNATQNKIKLESQHKLLSSQFSKVNQENSQLKDKLGHLQQQITLLSSDNKDKNQGLEQLKGVQQELFNTQAQVKNLQNELNEGKSAFNNLKNKLSTGKNAFDKLKTQHTQLKNQYNQGMTNYKKLQNEYQNFQESMKQNKMKFNKLQDNEKFLLNQKTKNMKIVNNEFDNTVKELINSNAINKTHIKELHKAKNPPDMIVKLGGILKLKHAGEMFSLQQALKKYVPENLHSKILAKVHSGEKSVHDAMLLILSKTSGNKIKTEPKKEQKFHPKEEQKFLKQDNKKNVKNKKNNAKKSKNNKNTLNNSNKNSGGLFNANPQHGQLGQNKMPNLDVDSDGEVQMITSKSHKGKINVGKVKKEHFDKTTGTWQNDEDVQIIQEKSWQGDIDLGQPLKKEKLKYNFNTGNFDKVEVSSQKKKPNLLKKMDKKKNIFQ